jgi:hypothetical protein
MQSGRERERQTMGKQRQRKRDTVKEKKLKKITGLYMIQNENLTGRVGRQ